MKKMLMMALLAGLLLPACKIQPAAKVELPVLPVDSTQSALPKTEEWFATPVLRQLIDTALRNNPDYLGNLAALQLARADLYARKKGLLPGVEVFAGAGLRRFGEYTMDGVGNFDTNFSPNIRPDQKMSNPLPDLQLAARVSWELDLWGKLRQMRRAAAKRYLATEAGLHWQRTLLVSEVAATYYELRALHEIQRIVKRNADLQAGGLELTKIKLEAGRLNALAVQQFEAQLARTQAMYHALQGDKLRTLNQLNLQLGQVQGAPYDTAALLSDDFAPLRLAGVPAQALEQRPDVRAATLALQAAGADVEAARRAFYPQLVLGPELGFQSFNPEKWLNPASLAWNLVGGLTAPAFQQGRLKAQLASEQARQKQAFQSYRQTALRAYTEIFNGLQQDQQLQLQYEAKQRQVNSLREGIQSATELYAAGYATYVEVVLAQNNALDAEIELVQVQLARYLNRIALYRALGGGW
jgi:NodT family efflux transporter outer membrane factor (OMF) lipoprotein